MFMYIMLTSFHIRITESQIVILCETATVKSIHITYMCATNLVATAMRKQNNQNAYISESMYNECICMYVYVCVHMDGCTPALRLVVNSCMKVKRRIRQITNINNG